MKKILFIHFILLLIFFLNIENVFALQIIKVDNTQTASGNPSSSQFVEIYNDTDIDIDITGYKLFDSGASKTGHSLSSTNTENNFIIAAKTYFIISTSNTIKSIFIGCKVFKYPISISSNDNIYFKKDDSSSVSFSVNSVNTLSSTDCNQNNSIDNSSNNNSASTTTDSTSVNSTSSDSPNIVYVYVPTNNQNKYGDITVLLPEEKLIPAGADSEFSIKVIDQDKKPVTGLDFQWSFGDGGEKFGQKVTHHYSYPGEYTLVSSADGYTVGGEAKMKVKVVVPDVSISKVGSEDKENYIDLTNNTDYDLVLSNFYLDLDNNFYKLPKNFTIAKKQTAHVSGEAVGFTLPATNISLNYPNKNLLISYLNKNDAEKTNPDSKIDSTSIYKAYSVANDKENINTENIPQVQDILEEKITRPIKIEEVKSETKPQKIESLKLKRLILNSDDKKLNSAEDKSVNLNKNGDVDTGIVNWLKTLIY